MVNENGLLKTQLHDSPKTADIADVISLLEWIHIAQV